MSEIAEQMRLNSVLTQDSLWRRWGPYISERAWGTVREDYSADGSAWEYLPHDQARSKAYRWNEDGIAGFSDGQQLLCMSVALWNGRDPVLKERLFGLTGNQGNHGEDVKEYYYYLDSTPTHSYVKSLYKYPHAEYPYDRLVEESLKRDRNQPEFELLDTGIFDQDRYFDVFVEYAKADAEDVLVRIEIVNRGPDPHEITVLPTVWFRNRWTWGYSQDPKPAVHRVDGPEGISVLETDHFKFGQRRIYCDENPQLLFTENNTNCQKLYHSANETEFVKDGINDYIIHGIAAAVNHENHGTKAAAVYRYTIPPGKSRVMRLRFAAPLSAPASAFDHFDDMVETRRREADEFYEAVIPGNLSHDAALVMRQAFAGLLLSKQYYHFDVLRWLEGDPLTPTPPAQRWKGRNRDWLHLNNADVISMPDKWEYPWYASWDLAFHMIPFALIDSEFAKNQLILLLREWYMHPNGQLPAYEWAFDDVNPPVHAWAAWRVYRMEAKRTGKGDRIFLQKVFHKLLLNFTWWVNRKDAEGNNIFQGGFLGLDNIGLFDRNRPLPVAGIIEQSDGTSWMAMYTLNMLAIAVELAREDLAYEDVASKFWEHFITIADAMNKIGHDGIQLWDERDGFYYDVVHLETGQQTPIRARSILGLIPLFAVETLEPETLDRMPGFKKRFEWFLENRPAMTENVASMEKRGVGKRRLLSIMDQMQLRSVLTYMLDENEFLSPFGIRSVSRHLRDHPFSIEFDGVVNSVDYEPAESTSGVFGGNSNWRGPIWMPINYLIIESLQKYHYYFGETFKVECPTGSGNMMNLWQVAAEISRRLTSLFFRDADGRRAIFGEIEKFQEDPNFRDYVPFHEYFHGDNGKGLGASHQTGWTALIAKLIQQGGVYDYL